MGFGDNAKDLEDWSKDVTVRKQIPVCLPVFQVFNFKCH